MGLLKTNNKQRELEITREDAGADKEKVRSRRRLGSLKFPEVPSKGHRAWDDLEPSLHYYVLEVLLTNKTVQLQRHGLFFIPPLGALPTYRQSKCAENLKP